MDSVKLILVANFLVKHKAPHKIIQIYGNICKELGGSGQNSADAKNNKRSESLLCAWHKTCTNRNIKCVVCNLNPQYHYWLA